MRPLLALVMMSSVAFAQPGAPTTATAQARLDAGTKAFNAKDFAKASREFAAGFAAEPWSGFLFAWAQSERRRGDCPSAIKLYTRFNATNPPAEVRQLSDDGIAACGGSTTTAVAEVKPPVVDDIKPPIVPDKPPVVETKREPEVAPVKKRVDDGDRPFEHKLALGLGAAAVVAGAIGVVFYVQSNNAADEADRAATHPQAIDLYGRAKDKRLIAQVSGGLGLGLAAAAVLRFVLHRPAADDRVSITPHGISYVARF